MTWFNGSGGAHHWKIRGAGNLRWFENRHSHYCISSTDYTTNRPTAGNGTPAIQPRCGDSNNPTAEAKQAQRWYIHPFSNFWAGEPFRLSNMRNGKCLDVFGWSLAENADVGIYDCHGGNNQKWRLVYAGEAGGS